MRIRPRWESPDEEQSIPTMEWMDVPRRNGRPIGLRTEHCDPDRELYMLVVWAVDRSDRRSEQEVAQ